MGFVTRTDIESSIREHALDQIIDENDAVLEFAIAEALAVIRNFMKGPGYDTNQIFSRVGTDRDYQVLGWAKYITLYKLYDRIPDAMVPERIIKNYDDCLTDLRRVSDGRLNLDLPRVVDAKGRPKTKFRWGSVKRRSH